jgi:hypothetical protein
MLEVFQMVHGLNWSFRYNNDYDLLMLYSHVDAKVTDSNVCGSSEGWSVDVSLAFMAAAT